MSHVELTMNPELEEEGSGMFPLILLFISHLCCGRQSGTWSLIPSVNSKLKWTTKKTNREEVSTLLALTPRVIVDLGVWDRK
jgi:hypothetical protein